MRPIVCMITDRTRLPALSHVEGPAPSRACQPDAALVAHVAAAARAGAHLIQIRERDLEGGALLRLVSRCVEAVGSTAARVLVNDRVDIALAAGAHGVHLRGDSVPAARVRPMVPAGFVIGRSVHALAEASRVWREGAVDYLIFGGVFETESKPGRAPAGLAALRAVAAATPVPVLAIGGVTQDRIESLAPTGAAGFAAIGLFADREPDELTATIDRASRAWAAGVR